MTLTEDILFAIEWLESNDDPVQSQILLRVADMLRATVKQRRRSKARRLAIKAIERQAPWLKNSSHYEAVVGDGIDVMLKRMEDKEQS